MNVESIENALDESKDTAQTVVYLPHIPSSSKQTKNRAKVLANEFNCGGWGCHSFKFQRPKHFIPFWTYV